MKISIITVTNNSEEFIYSCLNSVRKQTYQNFEHIIIDNVSSDNTLSVINKNFNSSKYIVNSKADSGMYYAMNEGIKKCTGEVVAFLNSDDYYTNRHVLSRVKNFLKNNVNYDGCYSDLVYVDRKDIRKKVRFWRSTKFEKGLFAKGWSPPHPTLFLRKKIYKKYGVFDTSFNCASDIDLMMRFMEVHKVKLKYVPKTFITMRYGGASNKSLTRIFVQNIEIFRSLKKNRIKFSYFKFLIVKFFFRIRQFFF